jgi:hypothetical protein
MQEDGSPGLSGLNITPSVEPDSRFFELCDAWMQCQDRYGRAVVYVTQDLMQIASGCAANRNTVLWPDHPSRSNVAEPLNNKQKPAGTW